MTPLLYLSAAEVRRALPMIEAIEAMREAFMQLSDRTVAMPTRLRLDVPDQHGLLLLMPCHAASAQRLSLKVVIQYSDNPALGLPLIQALVLLADAANGQPLAIMDGATLTALRTGAASGLATHTAARGWLSRIVSPHAGPASRSRIRSRSSAIARRRWLAGVRRGRRRSAPALASRATISSWRGVMAKARRGWYEYDQNHVIQ